jgi:hypothetical protein
MLSEASSTVPVEPTAVHGWAGGACGTGARAGVPAAEAIAGRMGAGPTRDARSKAATAVMQSRPRRDLFPCSDKTFCFMRTSIDTTRCSDVMYVSVAVECEEAAEREW